MKNSALGWDEWVALLMSAIHRAKSVYQPDILVPIMNGGLIPAGIVGKQMSVKDIRPISVGREGDKRYFIFPTQGDIGNVRQKNILIVEDDAMTGKSVALIKEYLLSEGAREVKTICVFIAQGVDNVEFFEKELPRDSFPLYPWKVPNFGNRQ